MGWLFPLSVLCALQLSLAADFLLPGDVKPSHYDLRLLYDIDSATNYSFYGVVDITLTALRPTSRIILHMKEFTLQKDKISLTRNNVFLSVNDVKLNEEYSLLKLEFDKELKQAENYTLTIPFFGNLKPGSKGVFISSYVDKDTENTEYLIATHFEPLLARKGFPCFDEPRYKATFRTTIGHHESYTAVSNMPLEKTSEDKKDKSNFIWDCFEKSVPMSTYLVAFVVSKLSYVESPVHLSKTKFKIWARREAINQTSYAAIIGPKILTHYEEWFNVSFPLPKLDMMAIYDFGPGAMENWGLIPYMEAGLLYDKKQSSLLKKEIVANVVAHEIAHQWFGNLVTMKWWSDLWLNEGFATYVESVGVDAVEPTWGADMTYAVANIMSVLELDALESSHPVSFPIDDPKRMSEASDEMSYRKGSTLIRMMTMFLGDKVFKEAIHNYLVKYSYQNAEQDDLWAELTAVGEKYGILTRNTTIKRVMDTWTTQTGYPLIEVEREYGTKSLTLTQKRYLALGANATTSTSWWVPLRVLCEVSHKQEHPLQWLADNEGLESPYKFIHGANPDEWVLFNADMIALYRVNYDERNWRLLANTLSSDKFITIPMLGRVQLLSDAFELAWTNRLNYTIALQLATYLQRENVYLPLKTGLDALSRIENVIKRSPDYGTFQKYVRRLVGDAYVKAGGLSTKTVLNGDDINSVKMQVLMSSWACRMKVPGCEENAIELFQNWMDQDNPDEDNPIPIQLRSTVYCVAVSRGSVREWRFALTRHQRSNVAAVQDDLLSALTCTMEVWILNQYLEWSITDGSEVRRQDAASVIMAVLSSTVGFSVAKDFVYNRIEDIYNAFNDSPIVLGNSIIKSLLNEFTKQQELDEFLIWREKNEKYLTYSNAAVSKAVEKARVNIDWITRNQRGLVGQLQKRNA